VLLVDSPHSVNIMPTISDAEKHKLNIIEYLRLKDSARKDAKCADCWHGKINCVCEKLPKFRYCENTKVIVYMDSKEMYNSGDDGKLLMCASPSQTSRFIYGMEDDELVAHLGMVVLSMQQVLLLAYLRVYVFIWLCCSKRPSQECHCFVSK
jgi:hypothetical protein